MDILVQLLAVLIQIMVFAILARSILSWFPMNPGNAVTNVLMGITEPILSPLRRVLPRFGMIDLSPMVAIILLMVVSRVLLSASAY
jgi:YggT family protein